MKKPTLKDAFREIEQYPISDEYLDDTLTLVLSAHKQSTKKYPTWPVDVFVGQSIIGEEVGEAEQEALDIPFDLTKGKGTINGFLTEHAQAAAMHIRQIQHILNCMKNEEELNYLTNLGE